MDLGTVLRRLERRRYADPHEFAADVLLTFRNAISYYNKGDPVYETAVELLEIFETGWAPILASLPPPPPPTDAERKERLRDDLPRMPMDAATLDELDQMGRRGRPDAGPMRAGQQRN
ncbi:hypothetical protein EJB05_54206 [Eragrostis curvula]|uniref:Bromo domain-containing protein n=1 Tax=Eragrostis curvula TaxID=38414 RepID=A0A5J9SN24_9POAL|nr:hypothetical protein EJB05_54206 [Eragrostis curvula]